MSRSILLTPLCVIALMIAGCGGGSGTGAEVKKGDQLIVEEDLREQATTKWEDSAYTDGFTIIVPKGTRLEIVTQPTRTGFECRPVEVNGEKDPEKVEEFFVPEHIRTRMGYISYSFPVKKEQLGKAVKKAG